ncbi:hypothetical protein H4R99_007789 [Coemansia sp. RSA 1722]|nr:hypothetical protein H4R99_007789 [Coemansia sp. RSA 1722]
MPRFLSRAGTNIDDLERQLARVGSAENDASSINDDNAGEGTALLSANSKQQSTAPHSTRGAHSPGYGSLSPSAGRTHSPCCQKQSCLDASLCDCSNTLGVRIDGEEYASSQLSPLSMSQQQLQQQEQIPISHPPPQPQPPPQRKLGTWDGVFLPVMLSIWGILVYVRMGYFLGQIGIVGTIGSFLCGYMVTTMTTLSISAISTNGTVKGGGPYYMLSRSLGPEFGGSIGLMFYIGTLLSGALNAVAFVEPLLSNFGKNGGHIVKLFPEGWYWSILYSSVLLVFCTTVCLIGARMFAKASTILSTLIIASTGMIILSFALRQPFVNEDKSIYYTGWRLSTFKENLWPELTPISPGSPSETLGSVLGVLFPACIGIMAGASMSSALRKPSKSIPKGTLWAVLITFILYMVIIVCLGSTTRRATLRANFNVLEEINILPIIVPIGAITTSVTSTLSGVLSSASILQAIAKDDLFACLKPFKRVDRNDNPTRAIIASYTISQLAFFVGDTNAVAPYATVFNLIMFAFVNFACLVLKLAASVNFRPTFHYFKAWTAFLGASGCFTIMLVVNMVSSLVSTAVVILLFLYVHYTCPPKPWGDVTQSLIYHQCRKFMLRLDLRKDHVKFWRPQILLLVHNPRSSLQLIRFCNSLKKGGLYVIGHVIKGRFYDLLPEFKYQEAAWLRLVDVLNVKAFVNLVIDENDDAGARSLVFGAGLGGMRPNIVVMGFLNPKSRSAQVDSWNNNPDSRIELPTDDIKLNDPISSTAYVRIIENVLSMGKAVGIACGFSKLGYLTPISSDYRWVQASSLSMRSSGSDSFFDSGKKQYIDLWPIQIGTAATTVNGDGQHAAYLTNFDSYVMVLQLGTVLHLVPYWNKHYTLRVMCFVEDQRDVDEEYRRVDKLLRDLRVTAELRVFYLRGAGLSSYDTAASQLARKASAQHPKAAQPNEQLPPNSVRFDLQKRRSAHRPILMSSSLDRAPMLQDLTTAGGFSIKVNLPMPLRYEASRVERYGTSSSGSGSSTSSSRDTSDSESETESDILPFSANKLSFLPRFATVSSGTTSLGRRLRGQAGKWGAGGDRRSSTGASKPGRVRVLSNPNAPENEQFNSGMSSRRRSDGSMVLSDFYSRALASVTSPTRPSKDSGSQVPEQQKASDSCAGQSTQHSVTPMHSAAIGDSGTVSEAADAVRDSEFNDMPVNTQNRILNEIIRRESGQGTTALIFTTLQAPELGASDSEQRAAEYLEEIETLVHGLPPVFLVHATSLTVTTSL